ncbi:MAG: hypothetical protein FWD53_03610 [Phycisphaerales bacterium]|nr:hypothetical protein [Phycisphaerales bacterium]
MKTAISLPDVVFREADRHARRMRKSRSQLYTEALEEYLARHAPDAATEAINQALADLGQEGKEGVDPVIMAATKRLWQKEPW